MSGTLHPFTEDELLAYVRKSASPELADRIDAKRRSNTALAAELALMEGLKPALSGMDVAANPPGELDWRRLEEDIRRESPAPANAPPASGRRLVIWQAAAALFGLAALGQFAYQGLSPIGSEPGYQISSQPSEIHVLALVFDPTSTEAEIRALLQATGARLIDGPGALGIYRVAFESPGDMAKAEPVLAGSEFIESVLAE